MKFSDELTIVIPVKNEEKLLPILLASLARQDYPLMSRTRVLIADAGSVDGTIKAAARFSKILPLSIIPGGLPSIGRNNGARRAHSRYLLFLDADVELAEPTLVRRAVEEMKAKSLHCLTTDIFCRDGIWLDRFLYRCNNFMQRLSRFHKPFATGMFMMLDKKRFDEIGGFDEQSLYAEDYQLTRQIARDRFRVIRGGVYSTNRRLKKMGRLTIVRLFLTAALKSHRADYFRSKSYLKYWDESPEPQHLGPRSLD